MQDEKDDLDELHIAPRSVNGAGGVKAFTKKGAARYFGEMHEFMERSESVHVCREGICYGVVYVRKEDK